MNPATSFERSIALWSFGWLPSDKLPSVAVDALSRDYESTALVDVACAEESGNPDLHRLFEKALGEIGKRRMSKVEAGQFIARDISRQIVDGTMNPLEGAKEIWKIELECDELGSELGVFGGRVTECEDLPDHRQDIFELIVDEAKVLLGLEGTEE